MAVTAAATFCATLVDEWVRAGVAHAVVAPGSRSTPLALALADAASSGHLRLHVHHDERAAAYVALGVGLASGVPAVLVCTSGTAAAEFHPAVIEAGLSGVPLVVCTADRPPELRDVGAPQAIDQVHLYGRSARWYCEPGVPDEAMAPAWRSLAARAIAEATGPRPGPVHLNLAFRDPLVGEAGPLPPAGPGPRHRGVAPPPGGPATAGALAVVAEACTRRRGVIVAGAGCGDPGAVLRLADALAWPVLADPRSGCRLAHPRVVANFDPILRHGPFAADHRPDAVLRLGAPPASKVLSQWLAASGATQVAVAGPGQWPDPERTASYVVHADPGAVCDALVAAAPDGSHGTPWAARWEHAARAAAGALREAFSRAGQLTEPFVAFVCSAVSPLVVSSSMPVRDVEWFGEPHMSGPALSNRGANGIEGVVSTGVGVALATGRPTTVLVGDVAFLHDTNALVGLAGRGVDLTIVIVDNDGGGIFSFLPQASAMGPDRFELLFGTPHGADIEGLCRAHGIGCVTASSPAGFVVALDELTAAHGVRALRVRTDRAANVAHHDALYAAVAAALGR